MGAGQTRELNDQIDSLIEKGDDLINEIEDFFRESGDNEDDFQLTLSADSEYTQLVRSYERWYSVARTLISQYQPSRLDDFESAYARFYESFDFRGIDTVHAPSLFRDTTSPILTQIGLIESLPTQIELINRQARNEVSSKISNDELQRARELFNDGEVRVAGVIAGVALERHLLTICENSEHELDFGYMDGISSLANTLHEGDEITDDTMRLLDYLGGVRNKCAHANEEDPEEEEVGRLLTEAEQFVREH